jgi:NTE family protein
MRVIVVWQGGGALGAYAAGVWRELAPRLQAQGARVVGMAGASIGAINAAVLVRHHADADWGAGALEAFWRERLATPSFPFTGALAWMPPFSAAARSWDGLLTGLLIGNRGLYQALPLNWNPIAGLQRVQRPLLDRSRMLATFEQAIGRVQGEPGTPWLGVAATDIQAGQVRLFGSDEGEITPQHLAASAAIPLLFEPVEIDGRLLWDGDMIRRSMLPAVIERIAAREAPSTEADPLVVISVELMPHESPGVPVSGAAIMARVAQIQQAGKLAPEEAPAALPAGWQARHLQRRALPNDGISNQFDYSPQRVEELIGQGRAEAREAWSQWTGEPVEEPRTEAAADAHDAWVGGPGGESAGTSGGDLVSAVSPTASTAQRTSGAPGPSGGDAPPLAVERSPAPREGQDDPDAPPTDPVAEAARAVLGDSAPPQPYSSLPAGTVH